MSCEVSFEIPQQIHHNSKPLQQFIDILDECRNYYWTFVYGNVGRMPSVLTACLSNMNTEKIGLVCRWETGSKFQLRNQDGSLIQFSEIDDVAPVLDYLIVVEPYFGQSFCKNLASVQRVIVLSSHFSFYQNTIDNKTQIMYHAFYSRNEMKYDNLLENCDEVIVRPPIFYDDEWKKQAQEKICQKLICFNLRKCQSADEAYFRLLTGMDMMKDVTSKYAVRISPRDKAHIYRLTQKEYVKTIFENCIDVIDNAYFPDSIF